LNFYKDEGIVYSFGDNSDGQLGHGNKENSYLPKEIEEFKKLKIKKIKGGSFHTIALTCN
jgi:alpha-tubulin suppressor-like RCC1 family protein